MRLLEIKEKIKDFVNKEIIALEPWILSSDWDKKLPKLTGELRKVNQITSELQKV